MSTDKDWQSLAAKFERHADEEGKVLGEYRVLAEKLGNNTLGNLVSHILTDEELHHLLLRTMSKWLREPAERGAPLPAAERSELLRLTQTLQRHEEETIDACSSLQTQLQGQNEELIGTLLDAMIMDSEKHRRLLVVVEKLLRTGC